MVKKTYTASDIEILKGIEPVQKRPGMYTDTSTPNHLLQEVIDNCCLLYTSDAADEE